MPVADADGVRLVCSVACVLSAPAATDASCCPVTKASAATVEQVLPALASRRAVVDRLTDDEHVPVAEAKIAPRKLNAFVVEQEPVAAAASVMTVAKTGRLVAHVQAGSDANLMAAVMEAVTEQCTEETAAMSAGRTEMRTIVMADPRAIAAGVIAVVIGATVEHVPVEALANDAAAAIARLLTVEQVPMADPVIWIGASRLAVTFALPVALAARKSAPPICKTVAVEATPVACAASVVAVSSVYGMSLLTSGEGVDSLRLVSYAVTTK